MNKSLEIKHSLESKPAAKSESSKCNYCADYIDLILTLNNNHFYKGLILFVLGFVLGFVGHVLIANIK